MVTQTDKKRKKRLDDKTVLPTSGGVADGDGVPGLQPEDPQLDRQGHHLGFHGGGLGSFSINKHNHITFCKHYRSCNKATYLAKMQLSMSKVGTRSTSQLELNTEAPTPRWLLNTAGLLPTGNAPVWWVWPCSSIFRSSEGCASTRSASK